MLLYYCKHYLNILSLHIKIEYLEHGGIDGNNPPHLLAAYGGIIGLYTSIIYGW
nr:MAG TPA_asm: Piezo non-specific cation channel, R-Ras-binding domain [Caudoviricetes sp.]